MTGAIAMLEAERFVNTLRVTTQTALAAHDLAKSRRTATTGASFLALAAKGVEDFRFPAAGLKSADELLLARLQRAEAGVGTLEIQAQGLAGLAAYANRSVRVQIGEAFQFDGVFDRDGRFLVDLKAKNIVEMDLAEIEVRLPV